MIKIESNEQYFYKITDLNSGNTIDMFFNGIKLEMNFDYIERDVDDVGSWFFRADDNISLFITKESDQMLYDMLSFAINYLYTWNSEYAVKGKSNQLNIIKDDEAVAIELQPNISTFDKSFVVNSNAQEYNALLTYMNAFVIYFNSKQKTKKLIKR